MMTPKEILDRQKNRVSPTSNSDKIYADRYQEDMQQIVSAVINTHNPKEPLYIPMGFSTLWRKTKNRGWERGFPKRSLFHFFVPNQLMRERVEENFRAKNWKVTRVTRFGRRYWKIEADWEMTCVKEFER